MSGLQQVESGIGTRGGFLDSASSAPPSGKGNERSRRFLPALTEAEPSMHAEEFQSRRAELMRRMGEGGMAIVPAAPERPRNRDIEYPYRQDSDLYYLTGFPEPESVAVLIPGHPSTEYVLFVRDRDPEREVWTGYRAGPEGACERYGADDAYPFDDLDDILPGLMERCTRVYYAMGRYPAFDRRVIGWVNQLRERSRAGVQTPWEFVALEHLLHDMRLRKTAAETEVMRRAAAISGAAHRRAMQVCRPGMAEYELQAEFAHEFVRHGCDYAYPPIVGSGANGCILHYTENSAVMADGELVLIDAGCELDCYASDITRTFPVNGRFSGPQREVYEIVLEAQRRAVESVRPGNHWNMPHEAALQVLSQGLVDLGVLEGPVDRVLEEEAYRPFFMHRTGHWLGMDVHDVGDYRVGEDWRELEPGMTLTVEPGLYLRQGLEGVGERYANIGVRIEDDVVVTAEGAEVLSGDIPKTVADIEALTAG